MNFSPLPLFSDDRPQLCPRCTSIGVSCCETVVSLRAVVSAASAGAPRGRAWFFTLLTWPFSALSAPMSMLLEMLSRCPRYLSQGPAMLMWSVVHLPLALISTSASCTPHARGCEAPQPSLSLVLRPGVMRWHFIRIPCRPPAHGRPGHAQSARASTVAVRPSLMQCPRVMRWRAQLVPSR